MLTAAPEVEAVKSASRAVIVEWIDTATVIAKAKERGWTEESADSLHDVVDVDYYSKTREFPSVTKAKAWASRNKTRDLWNQPSIYVYEWPNANRRSWERERVRHLRYQGGGDGWEEVA